MQNGKYHHNKTASFLAKYRNPSFHVALQIESGSLRKNPKTHLLFFFFDSFACFLKWAALMGPEENSQTVQKTVQLDILSDQSPAAALVTEIRRRAC